MSQVQTSNDPGPSYQTTGISTTAQHGDAQNIHNNPQNSEDALGSMSAITVQLDALMDNQRSNHRTLAALIGQPTPRTPDIGDVVDGVDVIEAYVKALVDMREVQESLHPIHQSGPSTTPKPSSPEPSAPDATELSIHDESGGEAGADPRIDPGTWSSNEPIQTQTLTQILDEIMLSTYAISIPAPPAQPPPLVHFVHNPILSAVRSPSPVIVDPHTAWPPPAPRYEIPPPAVRPPRSRPRQTPQRTPHPRPRPRPRPHRTQPPPTQMRTPGSETERTAIRAFRMERRARVDHTFETSAAPPPPQADPKPSTSAAQAAGTQIRETGAPGLPAVYVEPQADRYQFETHAAPPPHHADPGPSGSTARAARSQIRQASRTESPGPPRTDRHQTQERYESAPHGPPPPVEPQRAQTSAHRTEYQRENHNTSAPRDRHAHRPANDPPTATFPSSSWYHPPHDQRPRPPRPSPQTVQFPPPEITDNMLEILQETRRAQLTAIDEQREVMRYVRDFNGWLARQAQERRAGYEEVSVRVDRMRDELGRLRRRRGHDHEEQVQYGQ